MNQFPVQPWDEDDAQGPAGVNPLERSESGFTPASGQVDREEPADDDGDLCESAEHDQEVEAWATTPVPANLIAGRRPKAMAKPASAKPQFPLSPQQKILLLDLWNRSGLPARDFGALVGISRHTLYVWKRKFELEGPAGLMPQPNPRRGSKISEITKRAILMMKEANPDWGCQRISDLLVRGPALSASRVGQPCRPALSASPVGQPRRGRSHPPRSRLRITRRADQAAPR